MHLTIVIDEALQEKADHTSSPHSGTIYAVAS